ncbi:MAG: HU family DNA-binding protein [Prevotellaceae bacterium]|nr:HU family DNA-binding protein [Candidatus Minthosoma equi]
MSIPYRLTPLKDNISKSPRKGYYAQVVTKGTVDTTSLCREIAAGCTLTVADLRAAIEAISSSVADRLMDGYNVYIDGLGTFSLSAESKVVDSEEDLRSPSVKVKSINFRSAVSLKKTVMNSSFEKIKK